MKLKYYPCLLLALLVGCASNKPVEDGQAPGQNQGATEANATNTANTTNAPHVGSVAAPQGAGQTPGQADAAKTWADYELIAIMLDANKKPVKSIPYSLEIQNEWPFGKNAPKINIINFNVNQGVGKVLQVSCGTNNIKQKFDYPALLKGWATEFSCGKSNYFFLINPKG